jgi:hypothetical protein
VYIGTNDDKFRTDSPIDNLKPKRQFVIQESSKEDDKDTEKSDNIGYDNPNERALHKIVSNTLKYYEFNDNYNTDVIMKLFGEHDLIKYAGVATNNADPRDLNSIIDMGEYPIVKVFNKKSPTMFNDLENPEAAGTFQKTKKKEDKKHSDLTFLPPRPSKYLDCITYSE